MTPGSPEWFDDQYNNRARVPGHPAILRHWADASARALAEPGCVFDIAYGASLRERLDIRRPLREGAPLLIYIHGGYWRVLDRKAQAFLAPPLVAAGAMVVMLGYALCPAVTIDDIARQTAQALAWVWRHASRYGGDPSRIVVAGHSAGGHLATLLLAKDWAAMDTALPPDLVMAALSISGVYDLEPLRHAPFLADDIRLDAETASRLSPASMTAPSRGSLATVVGGEESEEFLRQAELIASAWGPRVIAAERMRGRNHMDVLHALAEPASPTHRLSLRLLGLD